MSKITTVITLLLLISFVAPAWADISLSGDVDSDFLEASCVADTGGQDVGVPPGVSGSGFDLDKVCFFYDGEIDALYVGVTTINDVIFGDANGDGDPNSPLVGDIIDSVDLGTGESFVISVDLDGDSRTDEFDASTVDVLIGVSNSGSLANLGVYDVAVSYDPTNNPSLGFGPTELADVTLFANPSTNARDLEFIIHDFKALNVEGIDSIINEVEMQIFAGSTLDSGIGDDFLPNITTTLTHPIFDLDKDGLEDWQETGTSIDDDDSDDDGLKDGVEVNGDNPTDPNNPDSDNDSCLDGEEDLNQNGAYEPFDGESDPNQFDSDGDEINDCLELTGANPTNPSASDTDGDGLLDGEEDANQNGSFEPTLGETDPNKADTDGGGVNDKDEIDNGFDPNDPSDDAIAAGQINVTTFNQVQGGGCSLIVSRFPVSGFRISFFLLLIGLGGLLLIRRLKVSS
ncbi:MAG: hypothetical protein ABII18_03115 [bacterium]